VSLPEHGADHRLLTELGAQPGEGAIRCLEIASWPLGEELELLGGGGGCVGPELEAHDARGEGRSLEAQAHQIQDLDSVEGGSCRPDALVAFFSPLSAPL
jgi:hypothetical protein